MRLWVWASVASVAAACGGSAFNPQTDGAAGTGGSGEAGTSRGGSAAVGGKPSGAGTSAGGARAGSDAGGRPGVAGSLASAGEPGTAGAAPEPPETSCPDSPEKLGETCQDGLACTWGDDIRTACRASARCEDGAWLVQQPRCPELAACQQVIVGTACDGTVSECLLAEGIFCRCTACPTSGPCNAQKVWACAGGSGVVGCPNVPPNAGAACNAPAPCRYGSCGTQNGLTATCDETWAWQEEACPNLEQ